MLRSRKFIAVLMAAWLPLFSGNALAVAVGMQTGSDCHPASAQQHHYHHAQTMQAESQAGNDEPACHQSQQNSQSNDCGICHLACCGYMATVSIGMAETVPLAQSYSSFPVRFESIPLTLPDPPPLALA